MPPAPIRPSFCNDLLELTHWLTRLKIEPEASTDASDARSGARARRGHG